MVSSSDDDGDGRESRSKMLKRHKAELLKAQKEGQRLGKKRGDEAAALVAQVTARHVAELAAFEAAAGAVETGPQEKQEATAEAVTGALEKATLAAAEPDVEESTGPSGKARIGQCVAVYLGRLREVQVDGTPFTLCVCPFHASRRRPRRRNGGLRNQKRRCARWMAA
jgi:hypothetical protein